MPNSSSSVEYKAINWLGAIFSAAIAAAFGVYLMLNHLGNDGSFYYLVIPVLTGLALGFVNYRFFRTGLAFLLIPIVFSASVAAGLMLMSIIGDPVTNMLGEESEMGDLILGGAPGAIIGGLSYSLYALFAKERLYWVSLFCILWGFMAGVGFIKGVYVESMGPELFMAVFFGVLAALISLLHFKSTGEEEKKNKHAIEIKKD